MQNRGTHEYARLALATVDNPKQEGPALPFVPYAHSVAEAHPNTHAGLGSSLHTHAFDSPPLWGPGRGADAVAAITYRNSPKIALGTGFPRLRAVVEQNGIAPRAGHRDSCPNFFKKLVLA